jgi:DNA-directed RNA polymerase I, II, and III subunit RPABC1
MNSLGPRYSKKEIEEHVMRTIFRMLHDRQWIDTNSQNQLTEDYLKQSETDTWEQVFTISKSHIKDKNIGGNVGILFYPHKLNTSINNSASILKFAKNKDFVRKIIIVKEIKANVYTKDIMKVDGLELFLITEVMYPIVDYVYQPKFEPYLTDDEQNEVLENYQLEKQDLPSMFVSDPVSRYYDLKVGQIIKIIRPSITAINTHFYRRVVPGNIDTMFVK